jgi:uncharacterized protein YjbI with pentapeptide repeats
MVRRIGRRPWPLVFVLVAGCFAFGLVMVNESSATSGWRDVGTSLMGSSVTGFIFAVVGRILEAQNRRRDFIFTLSQGKDLTGIDLRGQDLSGLYLSGKNLDRANLAGADLSNANLAGATLRQANLSRARLTLTNLAHADLRGAYLAQAKLQMAVLQEAKLDKAVLVQANLTSVIFSRTSLTESILLGATCRRMPVGFRLKFYLQFIGAGPIKRLKSRRAFQQAKKAGFVTGKSYGEIRREAAKRLRSSHPAFEIVRFSDCDLSGSDLRWADLHNADLTSAKLEGIHWNELTRWPSGYTPPQSSTAAAPRPVLPWQHLDFEEARAADPLAEATRAGDSEIPGGVERA